MAPRARPLLVLVGTLVGCTTDPGPSWLDQLEADSPCVRVDLIDGLDVDDTAELADLFACLNAHGHLAPLEPTFGATEAQTRAGTSVALEALALLPQLSEQQINPWAVAGVLLDAVRAPDRPADALLDASLELAYGTRANRLYAGTVELTDASQLQAGVLAPLGPVIPVVARVLLDDPDRPMAQAGEWLASPETHRWVRSLDAAVRSTEPTVQGPTSGLLPHLGQALAATRSPENDRSPSASGDSLRDAAEVLWVRPDPVIAAISEDAAAILSDPGVRAGLVESLDTLARDGTLQAVGAQAAGLTEIGVTGAPLLPGELSALHRFVRLLAENNEQLDCEIDLGLFSIEWTYGNLAVRTLEIVADLEPGQVVDVAEFVSVLTDNAVTELLLGAAIDAGTCPSLTRQDLDDLQALEILQEPEVYDTLVTVIEVLDVLKRGTPNHVPELADLVEELYHAGGFEPAEELLRDLGPTDVAQDLVDLVPVLADPPASGLVAGDEAAVTLDEVLELLEWGVERVDGRTGFERLRGVTAPVFAEDGTWVAVANLGDLMADDRTQVAGGLHLLSEVLALDPELALLTELAPLLSDDQLAASVLRILETGPLLDELLAVEPSGDEIEVPLAFWGRLVVDGTLDDLLSLVDRVLAALAPTAVAAG